MYYFWVSRMRFNYSSLHAHARKACKGTKIFSHTQAKTTKFLFLIFSSTATRPLPLLSPPALFLSLSSLTLPIIHSKIAVCFEYSRHIPDTYPTHTRYIRISYEYSTNTLRISHEYPIRQKKGREKEEKAPLFNRPHAFFLAYFKKKSYLCMFNSKCTIDNS